MGSLIEEFNVCRERMNEKILSSNNKSLKRLFSLDTLTY